MAKGCLAVVLVGLITHLAAQVPNNSISNRLQLHVDGPVITSTTAKSSVEWECISKTLTNKCLVYHNDQWFEFTVQRAGRYFLNLSSQTCNDKRGLQAIIIEGNPCKTGTYKILRCISKLRQEDVFIQLDSLQAGVPYLLNIDGFLNDYCEFGIQLSTHPKGLPLKDDQPEEVHRSLTTQQSKAISIDWKVGKARIDDFEGFLVFVLRPSEAKSILVNEQPVRRNTLGVLEENYAAVDSLKQEGTYIYRVYGIQRESLQPTLLVTNEVTFEQPKTKPKEPAAQQRVRIPLKFTEKTEFIVFIYDAATNLKLQASKHFFDPKQEAFLELSLDKELNTGIRKFLILVSDGNARNANEYYYSYNDGRFIRE